MQALFVTLSIAIITLLMLMLWFVPHLLQQQAQRNAREAAALRTMLTDLLEEQEAVARRQSQLTTSIAHLQDQLEQTLITVPADADQRITVLADQEVLHVLEERIGTLQLQIQQWLEHRSVRQRNVQLQDNEAWANLMGLLAAIQERVGALSDLHPNARIGHQAHQLLTELEQEMAQLRSISDDITTLQWRLRASVTERDNDLGSLRSHAGSSAD